MTKTNIAVALSGKKLKTNLGQSLLSLAFDVIGLLTGIMLILYLDVLSIDEAPWALFLFPGILSIRGAVGGLFSGHLGTGLHLGTIKATFTQNTKDFHTLLRVVITSTLGLIFLYIKPLRDLVLRKGQKLLAYMRGLSTDANY